MSEMQPDAALRPTVFAVLPVFDRLALTRKCLQQLLAQTYAPIEIVVADGGSSDGTPEAVRREFPTVTVLGSRRELWWAGSMAMGIDHVLAASRNADDLVLMMNNDTEFDRDYVETLAGESVARGAAVGALTVDSDDPSIILDGGEFIDWPRYEFPVKTEIAPGETYFDGVDVLPGRGTLVPLRMIRRVGNIDHRRFPHYISDYEFFCRIKRGGFPMGVTYRTRLRSHSKVTGIAARAGDNRSIVQSLRLLVSRRSMNNFLDHYRFIDRCAPEGLRLRLKRRLVVNITMRALDRLGLRLVVYRPGRRWSLGWLLRSCYSAARELYALFFPPYYAEETDCAAAGVEPEELLRSGLARRRRLAGRDVYVLRLKERKLRAGGRNVAGLYDTVRGRGQRWPRFRPTRMFEN